MEATKQIQERIEVLLHEMQFGSRSTMIDEISKEAEHWDSFTDMYELAPMEDSQLRNLISEAIKLRVHELIEALTIIDNRPF